MFAQRPQRRKGIKKMDVRATTAMAQRNKENGCSHNDRKGIKKKMDM